MGIGKGPSGFSDLGPVEKIYSFKLQKLGGGLVRRYVLLAKGSGIEASCPQQRKRMFLFWGAGGQQGGFGGSRGVRVKFRKFEES